MRITLQNGDYEIEVAVDGSLRFSRKGCAWTNATDALGDSKVVKCMFDRIVELEAEAELWRMRTAACGVAAMSNTRASIAGRLTSDNPYYTSSYADVCRAVDSEIEHRELLEASENSEAEKQKAQLAKVLKNSRRPA